MPFSFRLPPEARRRNQQFSRISDFQILKFALYLKKSMISPRKFD